MGQAQTYRQCGIPPRICGGAFQFWTCLAYGRGWAVAHACETRSCGEPAEWRRQTVCRVIPGQLHGLGDWRGSRPCAPDVLATEKPGELAFRAGGTVSRRSRLLTARGTRAELVYQGFGGVIRIAKAVLSPSQSPQSGSKQAHSQRLASSEAAVRGAGAHGVQRPLAAGEAFIGVAELLGRAGRWSGACLRQLDRDLRPRPSHFEPELVWIVLGGFPSLVAMRVGFAGFAALLC